MNTNNINEKNYYEANEGFIKGNMFVDEYEGYKNYKPLEPNINKSAPATLLLYIQKCGFAAHDIELYLDTHPYDTDAVDRFIFYRKLYDDAMKKYEDSKYNALTLEDINLNKVPFNWSVTKWPWEVI